MKWHLNGANAQAQHNLGWMYENGKGTPKNDSLAFHNYLVSALDGWVSGEYAVATMLEQGKGVTKNPVVARMYYEQAARKGHVKAQNATGLSYMDDSYFPNYQTAFFWFKKAAEQGYAPAAFNLYLMYQNKWGTEHDENAIQYWARITVINGIKDNTCAGCLKKR
jgi:uncharacterized protein